MAHLRKACHTMARMDHSHNLLRNMLNNHSPHRITSSNHNLTTAHKAMLLNLNILNMVNITPQFLNTRCKATVLAMSPSNLLVIAKTWRPKSLTAMLLLSSILSNNLHLLVTVITLLK